MALELKSVSIYSSRKTLAAKQYKESLNNTENTSSDSSDYYTKPVEKSKSSDDMLNLLLMSRGNSVAQSKYVSQVLSSGKFKGALKGKEKLIEQIANKYGVEPKLFAAILALESSWGASALALQHNNFGGVTGKGDSGKAGDFAAFSSVEKGIEAAAKNLAQYTGKYSDVSALDISNVHSIGKHYCVGGNWANKVSTIYNQFA